MPEQLPTIGRVVHFVPEPRHAAALVGREEHQAAIVTAVDPENDSLVHLTVFPPGGPPLVRSEVENQEPGGGHEPAPGTWHWPERV